MWHPGSEQPFYLALAAQRSCLLATHNILVQKTTALLILAEHSLILHQVARPSSTHGAAEQYVHYLVNIKGPRSWKLRDSGTTTKRDSIAQGHRCGHDLDSGSTPIQRNFPKNWHDTPGQYIQCTCKLTTYISTMTNNIMVFNQIKTMQNYYRRKINVSCIESHGLAYQTVTS